MKTRKLVLGIFKICIAIAVIMAVTMFIINFSGKAYDFGYRIFSEEPISSPPGYTMSVAIVEGKSVLEIGKILEDKGLIRNSYLFYLQEFVSDYHGLLKPGVYELSTAMTPEEMMAVMASDVSEEDEETFTEESVANSELQDAMATETSGEGTDEMNMTADPSMDTDISDEENTGAEEY